MPSPSGEYGLDLGGPNDGEVAITEDYEGDKEEEVLVKEGKTGSVLPQ